MKIYGLIIFVFIWAITTIGMIYAVIAGIWQYKPFDFSYQNSKIFGTCFIFFVICWFIAYAIKEWDNV